MARSDELIAEALASLPAKPADGASQSVKKNYSQLMSAVVADAVASELRSRGMVGTRPIPGKGKKKSGGERRIMGGIGPKKVDVSWATEDAGLLLAVSIKTINFRDGTSGNFQKNLTNRRTDMLFESITLHRRYPYSVLAGFVILDHKAGEDETAKRRSTFENANARLRLFTGRDDPAGRDEQYEQLYLALVHAEASPPRFDVFNVGDLSTPVRLDSVFSHLVDLVATRNADFYEAIDGHLHRV